MNGESSLTQYATRVYVLMMLASTIGVVVLAFWTLLNTFNNSINKDIDLLRTEQRLYRQESRQDIERVEGLILELIKDKNK